MWQLDEPQHVPNKQNNPNIEPRNRNMRSYISKNNKHVFWKSKSSSSNSKVSNPQLNTLNGNLWNKLKTIVQNQKLYFSTKKTRFRNKRQYFKTNNLTKLLYHKNQKHTLKFRVFILLILYMLLLFIFCSYLFEHFLHLYKYLNISYLFSLDFAQYLCSQQKL